MTRRDLVLVKYRKDIREVAARRNARSIALVGSVSRGEDNEDSDYDFLVDFYPGGRGLLNLSGLQNDLASLLDAEVDVVPAAGLRDHCRSMLDDAIVL